MAKYAGEGQREMVKPMKILEKAFFIKRVSKVGTGYAFWLPVDWVKIYCEEIEGKHWVELRQEGRDIIISALTEDDAARLSSIVKEVRDDRS